MTEKEFIEEQRKLYRPVIDMLDAVPIGEKIPSNWSAPEGFKLEKIEVEGVPVEHLVPVNKTSDRVIFHVHGGGYVIALVDGYRDIAVRYSQMAGGAEVFSIDYRVAPTDVYPAALDDAIAVYKWILGQGYNNENIIIVGDSAGGNLALVTTLYLKDKNMPLPKGVIGISPWSKLAVGAKSIETNFEKDCLLGKGGVKINEEAAHPAYLGDKDYKDPFISPIYGDFKGFPNLLIQIGSHEMLLDDALDVAKKAKEAGVNVVATVYEKMSHDFQLFMPQLEESKAAWEEMSKFVEDIFIDYRG